MLLEISNHIEIKRIEKVKDQISKETRRIKIKNVWQQEGGCNYVDATVILKHL